MLFNIIYYAIKTINHLNKSPAQESIIHLMLPWHAISIQI